MRHGAGTHGRVSQQMSKGTQNRKNRKKGNSGTGFVVTIVILSLVLIIVAALAVLTLMCLSGKDISFVRADDVQLEESDEVQYFRSVAENHEEVTFDEESGTVFINNQVCIVAEHDATEDDINTLVSSYDGEIIDTMGGYGVYLVSFKSAYSKRELSEVVEDIGTYGIVRYASINYVTDIDSEVLTVEQLAALAARYPDDAWNGDDWNLKVPRGENWGMEAVNAPEAWGCLDELQRVNIGLIDAIPNTEHEDLNFASSIVFAADYGTQAPEWQWYAASSTKEDHGSHVAGIMGAAWNGIGVSGMTAGKADMYYCNAYYWNDVGEADTPTDYVDAYKYAKALQTLIDYDVQAINISQHTGRLIGFAASRGNKNAKKYLQSNADLLEAILAEIIEERREQNLADFVICVSAGNNNSIKYIEDEDAVYGYVPKAEANLGLWQSITTKSYSGDVDAKYNNYLSLIDDEEVASRIIVVGSIGIDKAKSDKKSTVYKYSSFSNIGERVDICAPGEDIYSCYANGYGLKSGTSMATPHVTGTAGLVFAANPSLSGPDVKKLLCGTTGTRFYYKDGTCGLLDAGAAVKAALQTEQTSVNRLVSQGATTGLDLCFVVDTTGSMDEEIDNAKAHMVDILQSLSEKTEDYRVAVVDYRDFADRTSDYDDYPSCVRTDFSDNNEVIADAIYSLNLGFGGDDEETVYSGIAAALGLSWRAGSKKVIIVIGDAAPLDPEPYTGYTYDTIVKALYNADIFVDVDASDSIALGEAAESLINVYSIGSLASDAASDFFRDISDSTGGFYSDLSSADMVSEAIRESIDSIEIKVREIGLDFGDEYQGEKVDLYDDGGAFMCSVELDDEGACELSMIDDGRYKWKMVRRGMSGSMKIESENDSAGIKYNDPAWYTVLLDILYNKMNIVLIVIGAIYAAGIFTIIGIKVGRKVKAKKRIAQA